MNARPVLTLASQADWQDWLDQNHAQDDGVWLKLAKKGSGATTVQHSEALEIALCYGWIDGQGDKFDDRHWLVKFSPRRPKSVWSKRNREKVEALIVEGRMKPAGMAQVEAAKADGRWDAAYESQSTAEGPQDFLNALAGNTRAVEFYETLNRADRYSIFWRLHHSKRPETRSANIKKIVDQLARHEPLR
jgi:uncharacterized protein YdeI (YjbR/CyaY-like superfamily)